MNNTTQSLSIEAITNSANYLPAQPMSTLRKGDVFHFHNKETNNSEVNRHLLVRVIAIKRGIIYTQSANNKYAPIYPYYTGEQKFYFIVKH